METIKIYLDNMFARLPKTNDIFKIKNDLLSNMEEKYNELKNDGKSENEAIGIVISEFGNIDELISELGINTVEESSEVTTVSLEEADSFMDAKKKSGISIGIGVSLCILGAAMLILINKLFEDAGNMPGLIVLFVMVAAAVGIFIYTDTKLEKYKYLKDSFDLPLNVKRIVEEKNTAFTSTYTVSLIMGVCLCILSPVALFITNAAGEENSEYGVVILLIIISIAVFDFIYFGSIKESYSLLLKTGDYSKENTEKDKFIGVVASVVWPLAACIFLITGFIFQLWYINWIVFPITGILFGIFSSVYKSIKEIK